MLPPDEVLGADPIVAHPLTQPYDLPISPALTAALAATIVCLIAVSWPERRRLHQEPSSKSGSWSGDLSRGRVITRVVAVAVLGLAIAAGRLGADDELDNITPALVVGAAWPLLVLTSCVVGAVWRWFDPWDGIARVLVRDDPGAVAAHVWPAVAAAAVWAWYLSVWPHPLSPRSVGAALAVYTLVTVGGCIAVGRERWLATTEQLGIVLSWMALLPRRLLTNWQPPKGADALLGVLAGGVLFGAARRSELWGELNAVPNAMLVATVGFVVACVGFAGLLMGVGRRGRLEVARGAVPAVAGIIVAVAMDRNRLSTSIQLLPGLFGDPFGLGWDHFGPAGAGLDPAPLGVTGLAVAQLALLLVGNIAGALILARGTPQGERLPGAVVLSILMAAAVIAILTH